MTTDESNTYGERSDELRPQNYEGIDWGLIVFLTLGIAALLLPYISIPFVGVYWAAVVAIAVFVVWVTVMPSTCMNGGLICSLVAMAVLFNTIGIVLGAAVRFLVSLFS